MGTLSHRFERVNGNRIGSCDTAGSLGLDFRHIIDADAGNRGYLSFQETYPSSAPEHLPGPAMLGLVWCVGYLYMADENDGARSCLVAGFLGRYPAY